MLSVFNKKRRRPCVSRVLFPCHESLGVCHLSTTVVANGLYRPTLRLGQEATLKRRYTRTFNFRCARHRCHQTARWALTPPSHPYRAYEASLKGAAVIFFCTYRPSRISSILGSGHLTVLPGLSSRLPTSKGRSASDKLSGSASLKDKCTSFLRKKCHNPAFFLPLAHFVTGKEWEQDEADKSNVKPPYTRYKECKTVMKVC